jgi:tetratricopeptide (TPR) repeat protein
LTSPGSGTHAVAVVGPPRDRAERDRLLTLAAVGAGLVDPAATPDATAGGTASLADALAAHAGLGPCEHGRLKALEQHLAAPPAAPPADGAERFFPLRSIGRGNLGEVWVAFDTALDRLVAVKALRAGPAADAAERRARLGREARVTARIEHPAVVPIHATWEDAGGRPAHAMRLVAGQSLQAAIRRLHGGADGEASGPATATREALADAVFRACGALAAAHARGVVHRDVRPANLLREPDGAAFLIGWEHAVTPDGPDPDAGRLSGVTGFAAPEVAAGGPADARADIYGLGAVLYAIWTGDVPDGPQALDAGPGRSVPRGLAAICRKALAARPEDRHACVADLAAELRAWLDGRSAGPGTGSSRGELGRRRVVAACGLLVLAGLAATGRIGRPSRGVPVPAPLAATAGLDAQHHRIIEIAGAVARRLDEMAGTDDVKANPDLGPFRRGLAALYRDLFAGVHGALGAWLVPADRLALGAAVLDAARRGHLVDTPHETLDTAELAAVACRPLVADPVEGRRAGMALADALRLQVICLRELGRFDEAFARHDEALAILDGLRAAAPDDVETLSARAEAQAERAKLQQEVNRLDAAEVTLSGAIDLGTLAVRMAPPTDPTHRIRLLSYHIARGDLLFNSGQRAASRGPFTVALRECRALAGERRDDLDCRRRLVIALLRLAHLDSLEHHDDEALRRIDEADGLLDEVIAAEPDRLAHRVQRVMALLERASVAFHRGDYPAAGAALDRALSALTPLRPRFSAYPDYLVAIGKVFHHRGNIALRRDDIDGAIVEHAGAVAEIRRLYDRAPRYREARRLLSLFSARLAAIELRRGRPADDLAQAAIHARQADELSRSLLDEQPADSLVQGMAIGNLLVRAEVEARIAAPAEVLATLDRCADTLAARAPNLEAAEAHEFHRRLAVRYAAAAPTLPPDGAETALDRAMLHLEMAVALGLSDAHLLVDQPDLKPLRGRARFEALVDRLDTPAARPRP